MDCHISCSNCSAPVAFFHVGCFGVPEQPASSTASGIKMRNKRIVKNLTTEGTEDHRGNHRKSLTTKDTKEHEEKSKGRTSRFYCMCSFFCIYVFCLCSFDFWSETKKATKFFAPWPSVFSVVKALVSEDFFLLRNRLCVAIHRGDGAQGNEAALRFGFFQNVLAIEGFHAGVFSGLLHLLIAGAQLLFASGLGNAQIVESSIAAGVDVIVIQPQLVGLVIHTHFFATGEDLMAAMLFIPLGERGGHVHLFNDVAPAHAGVVSAETDFAFLRGIGNNALLSAAEVVIIEVLEPHSSNEQEIPAVSAALLDVFNRAITGDAAVLGISLLGCAKGLVKLPQQVNQLEVLGRLERIIIARQGQGHAKHREETSTACVVHLGHVFGDAVTIQERRNGDGFFRFLIDHHSHAYAAIRVASAAELSPIRTGTMNQIGPVREGGHKRNGKPVTLGLAQARLVLYIMRQMAQRIALRVTAIFCDFLVAPGKRNRLKTEEADGLGIVQSKLNDPAYLLIVDAVNDGGDGNNVHAVFMQILDGAKLHVKQVADLAVRVGGIADTVKLQVCVPQTGF